MISGKVFNEFGREIPPETIELSVEHGQALGFIPGYEVLCQGRWIWTGSSWTRAESEEAFSHLPEKAEA